MIDLRIVDGGEVAVRRPDSDGLLEIAVEADLQQVAAAGLARLAARRVGRCELADDRRRGRFGCLAVICELEANALTALAGCTAMDVVAILKKMKVDLEDLSVEAESELTDDHPRVFRGIKLTYRFKGKDLSLKHLEKAVRLSQNRYCGVSAMLSKAVPIEYEILIED